MAPRAVNDAWRNPLDMVKPPLSIIRLFDYPRAADTQPQSSQQAGRRCTQIPLVLQGSWEGTGGRWTEDSSVPARTHLDETGPARGSRCRRRPDPSLIMVCWRGTPASFCIICFLPRLVWVAAMATVHSALQETGKRLSRSTASAARAVTDLPFSSLLHLQ